MPYFAQQGMNKFSKKKKGKIMEKEFIDAALDVLILRSKHIAVNYNSCYYVVEKLVNLANVQLGV